MIEADRLDGFFVILQVSSGAQRDGYRARVRREDGLETSIDIPSTAISSDQKTILKKSEWEKRSLHMRINTRVRRGKIVSARLIQAGMEDRSKPNPSVITYEVLTSRAARNYKTCFAALAGRQSATIG